MRFVIDRNALNTPELRGFLERDRRNTAVLTDYLSHDVFSAPNTKTVREAFTVLADFPSQVLVLKNTRAISRLKWQPSGLPDRLVDEEQTRSFPGFCKAVLARRDSAMTRDLLAKSGRSYDHVVGLVEAAEVVRARITQEIDTYPKNEVECIRKGLPISESFRVRLIEDLIRNTKSLYAELGFTPGMLPSSTTFQYSMQFRFTLGLSMLQLLWVKKANPPKKPERVRNSITDVTYAAYATYFDGIMTNDRELLLIFNASVDVLRKLFNVQNRRSR